MITAGVGLSLDLVLKLSGEVQASGGFQMEIPDGEQVGIDIDLDLDVDNFEAEFEASASIKVL